MKELRFDGRTAIVTGAGGDPSLGRAFALLLARRGANVVVNDVGRVPEMPGYEDEASAEAVAEEIRALGGKAVADTNTVATEAGAKAMVGTAVAFNLQGHWARQVIPTGWLGGVGIWHNLVHVTAGLAYTVFAVPHLVFHLEHLDGASSAQAVGLTAANVVAAVLGILLVALGAADGRRRRRSDQARVQHPRPGEVS